MSNVSSSEAAKAVVRRNTVEVQVEGRFDVFETNFLPTISSTTHRSRGPHPTKPVYRNSTPIFVLRSLTFMRRSIGNLLMAIE